MNGRTTTTACAALVLALSSCGDKRTPSGSGSEKPVTTGTTSASAEAPPPTIVEVAWPPLGKRDLKPQKLGDKPLKGEVCKVDKTGTVMKSDAHSRALKDGALGPDGKIYVLDHENKLRRYVNQKADGCELAFDAGFGKGGILDLGLKPDDWANSVSVDKRGTAYVSGGGTTKMISADGKVSDGCGSNVQANPDSATVMSDFAAMKEGKCDGAPIELKVAIESRELVATFGEELGVKGLMKEGAANVVKAGIFSMDGAQKVLVGKASGDEEIFYAHDVQRCAPGLCVVDGNASSLRVWKADGTFVGKVDVDGLLGTDVMPQHGAQGKNAFWLFGSADGDKDDKESYGIVARITGI